MHNSVKWAHILLIQNYTSQLLFCAVQSNIPFQKQQVSLGWEGVGVLEEVPYLHSKIWLGPSYCMSAAVHLLRCAFRPVSLMLCFGSPEEVICCANALKNNYKSTDGHEDGQIRNILPYAHRYTAQCLMWVCVLHFGSGQTSKFHLLSPRSNQWKMISTCTSLAIC